MRQLLVQVPEGRGEDVLQRARAHDATNVSRLRAGDGQASRDLVILHVNNRSVEGLLGDLESIPDAHITLLPQEVIALRPPPSEAPEQVTNVTERSPIEVFLAGLQSIGSWRGFLSYAVISGIVVWIGLYTNTIFLLIAAMLISPLAGPAMNVAVASARGDGLLLRRGLLRYVVALAVTVATAAVLTFAFGLRTVTGLMVDISELSITAALLPLSAGVAAALNLVQSENSSLISGAAAGMAVAASLAPPAGVLGMALALGQWAMAGNTLFLLALQLVGINLGGAITFRLFGLSSRGARYERGKRWVFPMALALTAALLGTLMAVQFSNAPELQRSSRATEAVAVVQDIVQASGLAYLVEANVRFTRASIPDQNTLLGVVYVQRRQGVDLADAELAGRLTDEIQRGLLSRGFDVTPLVSVTVLAPPGER